ncbi:MAG: Trk family potassium uptake protein [Clostridia bacterium]|nr:Trk family potassium uptake protein [Clostridia bacterium]
MKRFIRNLSHVQIIALGFALLILVGTGLLLLPFSVSQGQSITLLDALFTATSASCVTGLVTVDTGTVWSAFGQGVILFLIQIGGLGFMTIATLFYIAFRKKMGLRQKEVMSESINSSGIGGLFKMARTIFSGTLLFEGIGALILTLRFFFGYGFPFGKALWLGIFHAVSAFCNAGFDINGNFSSFSEYHSDWVICSVLIVLSLLGGLGFFVWTEIRFKGLLFRRYNLHTKLVLSMSCILVFIPAVLFFFLEADASHSGLGFFDSVLASLFDAVSPRTAGMNITDTASLSNGGFLITIILMFIGGNPSSTAGGIKTTTLAVLILFAASSVRKSRYTGAFGKRIRQEDVHKALCVFFVNLSLVILGIFSICAIHPSLPLRNVIFEVFSAMGTVGMSFGTTRDLNTLSKLIVIILMFAGRVGSISFGSALMEKKAPPPVIAPYENITIG